MPYETDSFTLSKKAVEATAETCRRVLGSLSPKPQVIRKVYGSGSSITPMIVTETSQTETGENTFVDWLFQQPLNVRGNAYAFRARPWQLGATLISDLKGDEIYVDCTLLSTVLFTGQLFLMSTDSPIKPQTFTDNGKTYETQGQIVSGGFGTRWIGNMRDGGTKVDIGIQALIKNGSATRPTQCRVSAVNGTGATLFDGQQVICDYMAANPTSNVGQLVTNYNRWRITDYDCVVTT